VISKQIAGMQISLSNQKGKQGPQIISEQM